MSNLIYTGKYMENLPIKKGETHDVRVIFLPRDEKESIVVRVDDLYDKAYRSITEFMRYWKVDTHNDSSMQKM